MTPARSPTRIRPSHSAMTPARPSEISKPERAPSNKALSKAVKISASPNHQRTTAVVQAVTKNAIHTQFSTMAWTTQRG